MMDAEEKCRMCLQLVDASWEDDAIPFGEGDADWLCPRCFSDRNFTGLSDVEIACIFYEAGMAEQDPEHKRSYFEASLRHARQSDVFAALASLTPNASSAKTLVEEALSIDDTNCWPVGLYIELLACEGKFAQALEFLQSHGSCFPAMIYDFELARLLRAMGRDSEAQISLNKALDACHTDDAREMQLQFWEAGDRWVWSPSH